MSAAPSVSYRGQGTDASFPGASVIEKDMSPTGDSFYGTNGSIVEPSVLLTHPQLVSLPEKLAEIASRRPRSARVVTPLRKHVDILIEDQTGTSQEENPEEYVQRVEQERKEQDALLQQLKEEEEEALREEARIAEEEEAIRRYTIQLFTPWHTFLVVVKRKVS